MTYALRTAGVLGLALFASLAFGQPAKPTPPYRVGMLSPAPAGTRGNVDAFLGQLLDYGYVEGRNLAFEWRFADGREDRLPVLAAEFAQQKVDVLVAFGPSASQAAARQAPAAMPVVVSTVDAVEQGLVPSLGRPAGNVTGISLETTDLAPKQLAMLKEAIPRIARVGVVANPAMAGYAHIAQSLERGAAELGLTLVAVGVRDPDGLVPAFEALKNARVDALLVVAEPAVIDGLRARIVAAAAAHRLPAIYMWRMYVDAGGLMSYGPSLPALVGRLAYFVHRILSGSRPADLPVELWNDYRLVLNLKAARDLGITFPQALRLRADDAIQ